MTITLRRVTADDWETWRPVRLAALTESPGAFGSTVDDWAGAPEQRWRARLSVLGALDLVAVDGERIVGLASGVPGDESETAELISMWVDPVARRSGVATMLIRAIATWAAQSGATALELSVMPDNADARRTYERNDFYVVHDGTVLGELLPDGRREVVMCRDLAPERSLDADGRARRRARRDLGTKRG